MAIDLTKLFGKDGLTYLLQKIKQLKTELLLEIQKKSDFSGKYEDLTNKPESLPNPETLTFTGSQTGTYNGSSPLTIQIPTVYMTQTDKNKLDEFSNAEDYALKSDISTVYRYKGSLENDTALPTNAELGDTYNLVSSDLFGDGANVAWDGTKWDNLGSTIDLSGYVEKTELQEIGNEEIDTIWNTVFGS